MKIISWNVAGVNAAAKKGLLDFIKKENADIYCFQEVKAAQEKLPKEFMHGQSTLTGKHALSEYTPIHSFSEKKGYSGVSTITKIKPKQIIQGIGKKEFDSEGRVHTLEFEEFFLINAYFPNASRELTRLDYKLRFNKEFEKFCKTLLEKPIIITGDLNVAHKEIDLANPKQNKKNAGFTPQERNWFGKFLDEDFADVFREFNKEAGQYTYWTYRGNARKRNIGWRLDYFVADKKILPKIKKCAILKEIYGSDHCPIMLETNLK